MILTAMAVERITEFITNTTILDNLRLKASVKSLYEGEDGNIKSNYFYMWLKKILTCGWCCSGEVSLVLCWFLPGDYFGLVATDNILIKFGSLWLTSNVVHTLFSLLYRGRVKSHDINVVLKMNEVGDGEGQEHTISQD